MTSAVHHIRCKLSTLALWKALADPANKHIAEQVQMLEINPDSPMGVTEARIPDLIPPGLSLDDFLFAAEEATDDENTLEQEFISALAQLNHLERFVWKRIPGPRITGEGGVWSTIAKLRVGSIRLVDNRSDGENDGENTNHSTFALDVKEFLQLRNLTSFNLKTYSLNDLDNESDRTRLESLQTMLIDNMPNIENLNLDFCTSISLINVSQLLSRAHWDRLREITFLDASCTPKALNAFLSAHPTLVSLRLSSMMGGRRWGEIELPEGALPNLMHLHCTSYQAARILARPSARPLYLLAGVEVHEEVKLEDYYLMEFEPEDDLNGDDTDDESNDVDYLEMEKLVTRSPWREEFLVSLRQHSAITHLALHDHEGMDELGLLFKAVPHLQWVDVGSTREGSVAHLTLSEWANVFSELKDLRTINMQPRIEKSLPLFAQKCPSLETYEDWRHIYVCHRNEGDGDQGVTWSKHSRPTVEGGCDTQHRPYPSASFARATLRRLGGPCVPGPIAQDVFYTGRPFTQ
ncbi:hypothetical protein BV22DRAFT_1190682 [Leucogyrophana mollusca]|uniref:Uncharacterized protein n=1 Tax=Leucogyrophana mollusca TaxID=85980 RepID=A0ACB8C0F0_9AGAM|nr:hypothetical protein BV22DRAFT_1190682 [Leucogyrophana mollusca]